MFNLRFYLNRVNCVGNKLFSSHFINILKNSGIMIVPPQCRNLVLFYIILKNKIFFVFFKYFRLRNRRGNEILIKVK